MPAPNKKSGRFKKVTKKAPGGRLVEHFEERKPKQAKCSVTGKPLHGIPRKRPSDMRNLSKSQRRPNRPYGGVLSSKAMREQIIRSITSTKDTVEE